MMKIKRSLNLSTLLLIMTLSFAFKAGDIVELETYVNAHVSASFTKNFPNVKTVLKTGTTGEVSEVKKLPSGNFGIKMKINSGPHANESYWVYYNLKNPAMKISDKNNEPLKSTDVEKANQAKLTKDQLALRNPVESALLETVKTTNQVLSNNPNIITSSKANKNCEYFDHSPIEKIDESHYSEQNQVEPFTEVSTSPLHSSSCRASGNGYDVCKDEKGQIDSFQLVNEGGNKIVQDKEYYINRNFTFEFSDRARSDMKLLISDAPDDTTSHITYSAMVFLPRKILPSIKKVNDELIVVLPTKEIVKFNAQTKEIIGGALAEGPMKQEKNKKAAAPNVQYRGYGVLIRADKSGDLPYGDIELSNGKNAPSISTATISKNGFKDCKVPSKDLWFTDHAKGGEVYIKSELANDEGMDRFIKKRCGLLDILSRN